MPKHNGHETTQSVTNTVNQAFIHMCTHFNLVLKQSNVQEMHAHDARHHALLIIMQTDTNAGSGATDRVYDKNDPSFYCHVCSADALLKCLTLHDTSSPKQDIYRRPSSRVGSPQS